MNYENAAMEYTPEFEAENFLFEQQQEWSGEGEVFGEAELMELAAELMEVNSEAELDQFLGKLIRKAARGIKKVASSSIGRAIGGQLKNMAKQALPMAGTALGGFFGGPLGAKIGDGLASAAADKMELEQLEAEDKAFEGAKNFVQLSGEAVKSTLSAPSNMNPQTVAQQAVAAAAAKHAPGMMASGSFSSKTRMSRPTAGKWRVSKDGRHIILIDAAVR